MRKFWGVGVGLAILMSLVGATTWGQTGSTATHHATHATRAVRRSLMNPASLNQRAPDIYKAKFTTTKGDFVLEVTRAWAPLGADRFYNLVKNGFYNNVEIFRVVPGFVVQFGISGDPKIAATWTHAILADDSVTQSNKQGTITYATAGPNTRTTQVFINLGDNSRLDGQGFAPFGTVVEGMDVIEKFDGEYADQPTGMQDQIESQGNPFLKTNFPNLDLIKSAMIVAPAPVTMTKKPAAASTHAAGPKAQ